MENEHYGCARSSATQPLTRQQQVVAMAYVPIQEMASVYETETGWHRGTIFPELDKPFMAGGRCCVR